MAARGALLTIVTALLAAAPAAAATDRTETPLPSRGDGVAASVVTIAAPMPAGTPAHPAACDTLSYLRLRNAAGPRRATRSHAVLVAMPGILAGAESLEITGRNVVRAGARGGRNLEFWALDRRSNCLEDHWGVLQARAARDPQVAFDYAFGGKTVAGRRFAGLLSGASLAWLSRVGLAQTVQDEITVITRELPESFRTRRLLCGGHSLGGPLTGALAAWDWDGDPATTTDAGFRQCAGFFTLDTRLPAPTDEGQQRIVSALGLADGLAGGISPTLTAGPPFSSEVFQLVPVLGLAAELAPRERSAIIGRLPRTDNVNSALGLLMSRDWLQALTGQPDIRTLNATNTAALASVFDNNSSPITILRTGLGMPSGGPIAPKEFPVPFGSGVQLGILGGARLGAPAAYGAGAPLYDWRDWRQNAAGPPLLAPDGRPYGPAGDEVTDVAQFAREMAGDQVDFLEQYFPTRMVTDLGAFLFGDRSGTLRGARYNAGAGTKPVLNLDAERGLAPMMGGPVTTATTRTVVLPGHWHLDVGTAAETGPDGAPALLPAELASFAVTVAGS